jgi:hypothetical protein
MAIEEPGEESPAEQAHQEGGVPLGQADEGTTCGKAAVAGEDVQVGVPLQEISCGGEGDDQAGAEVHSGLTADELDGGLGPGPGELGQ